MPSIALPLIGSLACFGLIAPPDDQTYIDTVYYDEAFPDGSLQGGVTELTVERSHDLQATQAHHETLVLSGDPSNRIDIVFVGDGYLASELSTYAASVDDLIAEYFAEEPFIRYASYFNTHRVDVVSNESGVDHDPTFGIYRDTALDMEFWCSGIDRLLCVNVGAAYSYADNAPDADLVAAIANSFKYGGAGYSGSDLATASSENSLSTEVLLHEFGHALGNLADEYHYGDGTRYNGSEVGESNASILSESEMLNAGTKWAAWIGVNDPAFDGMISSFEGARYYQYGINRPTNNSMMNSLNRPFNLPSIESILIEMYKTVRPIDMSSSTDATYAGNETLFVTPMEPLGFPLDVQWSLNGVPINGATESTLDLASLNLNDGAHVITVTVTDNTAWVRDEDARTQWMEQTLAFDVQVRGLFLEVDPLFWGQDATLRVTDATPQDLVYFVYSLSGEGSTFVPQLNVTLDLDAPTLAGTATADDTGLAVFSQSLPNRQAPMVIWMQAAAAGESSHLVLAQIN